MLVDRKHIESGIFVKSCPFALRARVGGRLGPSIGSRATTAASESKALHNSKASEDGPDEEGKGHSSLCALAEVVTAAPRGANEGRNGDGAGKPEDGGDDEQAESDHGVVGASEEARRQGEIEEDEDGPDDAEEDKGEGGRRAAPPPVVEFADDCNVCVSRGLEAGENEHVSLP